TRPSSWLCARPEWPGVAAGRSRQRAPAGKRTTRSRPSSSGWRDGSGDLALVGPWWNLRIPAESRFVSDLGGNLTRTREPTRERKPRRHPAPHATAVDPHSAGRGSGRGGRLLVLADFPGRPTSLITDGDTGHERRDH